MSAETPATSSCDFDALLTATQFDSVDLAVGALLAAGSSSLAHGGTRHLFCSSCNRRLTRRRNQRYYKHPCGTGILCGACYNDAYYNKIKQEHSIAVIRASSQTVSPLTADQQSSLKQTMEASGVGQQGKTRSVEDNARALLLVNRLQETADVSFDKAIKLAADLELTSPKILRSASKRFQRKNDLNRSPRKERIKRNNPEHPLYLESGPSLPVSLAIHGMINEATKENRYLSITTIRLKLKAENIGDFPKSTLHRWMCNDLQLEYGLLKFNPLEEAYSNARIRKFILEYSLALKEQDKRKAVIVYMDESFIYQGQRTKHGWYYANKEDNKNVYRGKPSHSGKRIIVLHAMTKDGMLTMPGVDPSNLLSEEYLSCALVFYEVAVDGISPADYHNSINGDTFVTWLRNRLIPTFKARYPRKKMYLVLDNAKYHHHRGEDWITPRTMTKGQCANFLRQNGVNQITITRSKNKVETTSVVKKNKFSADLNHGGPTMEGLRSAVQTYLLSHPGINTTVPVQLMSDAKATLIYTPPYESWLQPIELAWARMKHEVNTQAYDGRTHQETAAQTYTALANLDNELCSNLIGHVLAAIDDWLTTPAAGSLRRFGSIAAIQRATKEQIATVNDISVDDTKESFGEDITKGEEEEME